MRLMAGSVTHTQAQNPIVNGYSWICGSKPLILTEYDTYAASRAMPRRDMTDEDQHSISM